MADYYYTEKELKLLESLGFSLEVFEVLKRLIVREVRNLKNIIPERFAEHILNYYPHEIESINKDVYDVRGSSSLEDVGILIRGDVIGNPEEFIIELNTKIAPLKHIAFLTTSPSGSNTDDAIGIIPGENDNLILTFLRLGKYSLRSTTKEEVFAQLKELKEEFEISFIGVGGGWLTVYMSDLPSDIDRFLAKIKEVAPNTFTWWGKETKEEAYTRERQNLIKNHSITLWWED